MFKSLWSNYKPIGSDDEALPSNFWPMSHFDTTLGFGYLLDGQDQPTMFGHTNSKFDMAFFMTFLDPTQDGSIVLNLPFEGAGGMPSTGAATKVVGKSVRDDCPSHSLPSTAYGGKMHIFH